MAIEDEVSPNAVKVYKAMKEIAMTSEEKMGTAERVQPTCAAGVSERYASRSRTARPRLRSVNGWYGPKS